MELAEIQLVTFDVFGTLMNWQGFVEKLFPARFQDFLAASENLQRTEVPRIPYAALLRMVATELEAANSSGGELLATRLGMAPAFQDSRALIVLQQSVLVGCVSNSDFRHQCDVQRTLGFVWDTVLISEASGHYKPSIKMWEWAVERIATELKLAPRQWLHVSAYADYDILPAAELGINVCYLPRPGGSAPQDLCHFPNLFAVSDLFELTRIIQAAKGAPVVYRVDCETPTAAAARDFRRWVQYEHGDDLLNVPGCLSYQVTALSETASRCEYIFRNHQLLEQYFASRASVLRQKAIERFGEGTLRYTRSISELTQLVRDRRGAMN